MSMDKEIKKKKIKLEKRRLACETRRTDTMVAVYSVLACGIIVARL
jgi:hypothetical protein